MAGIMGEWAAARQIADARELRNAKFLIEEGAPASQFVSDDEFPVYRCYDFWEWKAKRALDMTASTIALCFLLPFFLAIAAAIKLTSGGPVLFRQKRYGLGREEFEILKFRTMYAEKSDPSGVTQTSARDPRSQTHKRDSRAGRTVIQPSDWRGG
jgi:lipopolysaccharide/colanic/teichoic acid biosynthesis glycosyltransferase